MKMHCPHCGVKGSVDDSFIGRKIRCPKCQNIFPCEVDAVTPEEIEPDLFAPPVLEEAAPASDEIVEDEKAMAVDEPDDEIAIEPQGVPTIDTAEVRIEQEEPEIVELTDEIVEEQKEPEEIQAGVADQVEEELAEIEEEQAVEEPIQAEAPPAEPVSCIVPEPPIEEEREVKEAQQLESEPAPIPSEVDSIAQTPPVAPVLPVPGKFAQGGKPKTDFTVGEALTEAWQYTKGSKALVWGASGMMYLIMLILGLGLAFLQTVIGFDPMSAGGIWVNLGASVLNSAISTILTAGLMYVGVRRAAEKNCSWKMIFAGFPMAVPLLVAFILMTLLMVSGFVLLILPGIYLWVGYSMTLPLMLDRNLGPWEAMEVSRRTIHKVWWQVFGLCLLMGLILFVSAIPLGIGLIWTVPMSVMLYGVVYRYLFGVQQKKG